MQLTIIAAIFVAIAGVVFAIQNNAPVTVDFFIWQFTSSLALVLMLAVAVGAMIVALLTTPATLRRQWLIAQQKRRIDALEKDLGDLRARTAELDAIPLEPAASPEKPFGALKDNPPETIAPPGPDLAR